MRDNSLARHRPGTLVFRLSVILVQFKQLQSFLEQFQNISPKSDNDGPPDQVLSGQEDNVRDGELPEVAFREFVADAFAAISQGTSNLGYLSLVAEYHQGTRKDWREIALHAEASSHEPWLDRIWDRDNILLTPEVGGRTPPQPFLRVISWTTKVTGRKGGTASVEIGDVQKAMFKDVVKPLEQDLENAGFKTSPEFAVKEVRSSDPEPVVPKNQSVHMIEPGPSNSTTAATTSQE
ncbi:hypothetical protein QBC38DRAFT_523892 [Podospora fimiseda]|uniref:Uncharacterized protein n=1 Tax=Podospora fimiseda TaxID=252190 RepID=A0AAN7BEJ4_9PEZI|nr:hypothetical protein QBC38DRAFT_523892 [Podospora fimiseda]